MKNNKYLNIMTPIIFKKIKNSLFNDYALTERGRFVSWINEDNDMLWQNMGEKTPTSRNIRLTPQQKTDIFFERMEKEPSPKRFIELCQIVAAHMIDISNLTSMRHGYSNQRHCEAAIFFLGDVISAFEKEGVRKLLDYVRYEKYETERYKFEYIGNNFADKESELLILNGFYSLVIEKILINADTKKHKNLWLHKFTGEFLLKIPFIGHGKVGYEGEKK